MKYKKLTLLAQIFFIFSFIIYLCDTNSKFSIYVLCAVAGTFALAFNMFVKPPQFIKRKVVLYIITSVFFSICIIFSNFYLWLPDGVLSTIFKSFFVLIGGTVIFFNILFCLDNFYISIKIKKTNNNNYFRFNYITPICFLIIISIYLVFLLFSAYPGCLSPDSISQVKQALTGNYKNHHPFWHTILIKLCLMFGMKVFNNINASVACYSVLQIIFMSVCFSFCILTMYQAKIPKLCIVSSVLFFAFMPYHIIYSVTMWKDVPFGGAVLLLIVSLFRIFNDIGKTKWINWLVLIFASMGMCLWRSNGWMAFLLMLIVFSFLFLKKYKTLFIILLSTLIASLVMVFPTLSYLKIPQPDIIESLSIPAQQIARVVTDCDDLNKEEYDLLNKIIDVEKIPDKYKHHISDPIKGLVRESKNEQYLQTHKLSYLRLWLSLGIRHPLKYIRAFVDQTKGYWNGGYQYWIWGNIISKNNFSLSQSVDNSGVKQIIDYYFDFFCDTELFDVFDSIGFCTWIIIACGCINLANKRKKQAFLSVPILAIIFTLCIATPVFSEFRYAYALFTCVPFIIVTTFYYKEKEIQNNG